METCRNKASRCRVQSSQKSHNTYRRRREDEAAIYIYIYIYTYISLIWILCLESAERYILDFGNYMNQAHEPLCRRLEPCYSTAALKEVLCGGRMWQYPVPCCNGPSALVEIPICSTRSHVLQHATDLDKGHSPHDIPGWRRQIHLQSSSCCTSKAGLQFARLKPQHPAPLKSGTP